MNPTYFISGEWVRSKRVATQRRRSVAGFSRVALRRALRPFHVLTGFASRESHGDQLLVDGVEYNLIVLEKQLQREGYVTARALDGEQGLAAARELRAISRNGVGVDNLPLPTLEARGIAVRIADGANAAGVAELAVGLMHRLWGAEE